MENISNQTISSAEKARQAARAIKVKMVAFIGAGMALVIGLALYFAEKGMEEDKK